MPKRIYLDTNHWIRLLALEQGKKPDEFLNKIFVAIKKLAELDKIRVLYSGFTLNEIWKYHDLEQQSKLIDLILDISKLWVLKPYTLFAEKEIENAATFVLEGKYLHDLHSEILGRGLGDIFDVNFDYFLQTHPELELFIKNNPRGLTMDIFKQLFQKINNDLDFIKETLKSSGAREVRQKSFEENKQFLKDMENARFKNSKMSKDIFSRFSQARALVDSAVPHLVKFMQLKGITPEILLSPNPEERIELFNLHLKSMNVLTVLVLARDFSAEKQLVANDAYDMAHLSGAIPYCDVVVTEKMFARISIQKKLDKMYNCVILDNLEDISEIEPIKSEINNLYQT